MPATVQVNHLKRFTICKLLGHHWVKVAFPPTADGESTGTFVRCLRCRKENYDAGSVARGAGGIL